MRGGWGKWSGVGGGRCRIGCVLVERGDFGVVIVSPWGYRHTPFPKPNHSHQNHHPNSGEISPQLLLFALLEFPSRRVPFLGTGREVVVPRVFFDLRVFFRFHSEERALLSPFW